MLRSHHASLRKRSFFDISTKCQHPQQTEALRMHASDRSLTCGLLNRNSACRTQKSGNFGPVDRNKCRVFKRGCVSPRSNIHEFCIKKSCSLANDNNPIRPAPSLKSLTSSRNMGNEPAIYKLMALPATSGSKQSLTGTSRIIQLVSPAQKRSFQAGKGLGVVPVVPSAESFHADSKFPQLVHFSTDTNGEYGNLGIPPATTTFLGAESKAYERFTS
jgi:hypothetical protein